jgi:hypothetical protein
MPRMDGVENLKNVEGHFFSWDWRTGLRQAVDGKYPLEITTVMGHNEDATKEQGLRGAVFAIVAQGMARVRRDGFLYELDQGQWVAFDTGTVKIETFATSKVLLICAVGRSVLFQLGGPIELIGRLRYIDGCTDTMLVQPWKLGEPCLNHLHIPPGVNQTMHIHPTDRIGVVVRGHGWCETPDGTIRMDVGMVWRIPANGRHRFITESGSLDVIAFHPDSDSGPTDDEHPMLSRTLVSGVSAKYLDNIRTRDV